MKQKINRLVTHGIAGFFGLCLGAGAITFSSTGKLMNASDDAIAAKEQAIEKINEHRKFVRDEIKHTDSMIERLDGIALKVQQLKQSD